MNNNIIDIHQKYAAKLTGSPDLQHGKAKWIVSFGHTKTFLELVDKVINFFEKPGASLSLSLSLSQSPPSLSPYHSRTLSQQL